MSKSRRLMNWTCSTHEGYNAGKYSLRDRGVARREKGKYSFG
jgi:hypothetical protein